MQGKADPQSRSPGGLGKVGGWYYFYSLQVTRRKSIWIYPHTEGRSNMSRDQRTKAPLKNEYNCHTKRKSSFVMSSEGPSVPNPSDVTNQGPQPPHNLV